MTSLARKNKGASLVTEDAIDQQYQAELSTPEECGFLLAKGFYLIGQDGRLKTKDIQKGKPGSEDRRIVTEPISCRTLNAAKDVCAASGSPLCILCVTEDGFYWRQ